MACPLYSGFPSPKTKFRHLSLSLVRTYLLIYLYANSTAQTEGSGRVVNTPASFSGGPGLKSRTRRPVSLTEVFLGFPQSLQANAGIVP
jgi:hypothetical protein